MDRLARILEKEKIRNVKERKFDAIVVFVDELNKFAPSGRGGGASSLKSQIVDIAARGRSIGLILIGAEQFASSIDREIYGNTSTHLVGRTEYAELTDPVYRWISGDLRYLVSNLPKGTLLLKHALFPRPIPIHFPRPIFTYTPKEVSKLSENKDGVGKHIAKEPKTKEEEILVNLIAICRKRRAGSEILYKNCDKIRKMGVSKSKFNKWFGKWSSTQTFVGNTKEEHHAAEALLEFVQTLQERIKRPKTSK